MVAWESREIDLNGGAITDNFGPYEVRIYSAGPSK
jgi:hypothetical protein